MQTSRHILYHSRVSELCIDLLRVLDSCGALRFFRIICIDDLEASQIPPTLKRVPTMIIIGIPAPFVGKDAINWISSNKMLFMNNNAEYQTKKIMYNMMQNMTSGPLCFSDTEHIGTSDNFAYTDLDNAQPKTFCEYGKDKDIIYTPPSEKNKMCKMEQDKNLHNVEIIRKKQEQEYQNAMKHQQVDAIMLKEREKLIKEQLGLRNK